MVYAKQDSLGLKPWGAFAAEAGVVDTARVAHCAVQANGIGRIAAGIAFGKQIGVNATPTVIINGWRFQHPPSPSEVNDVLDSLKKGVQPFARVSRKTL